MTRKFSLVNLGRPAVIALATSVAMTLVLSSTAFAQHGHRAPSSGGGGQSSGSGSSGGGGSRASGGGQTTQSAPATASTPPATRSGHEKASSGDSGSSGRAVARGGATSGGESSSGGRTGGAVTRDGSGDTSGGGSNTVPPYSRPREGRNATGDAVARRPNSTGGGTTVIIPRGGYGGYYPWGYGGLGFGGYYGAGYYDPWWDDPYGYGYGGSSYGFGYDGALKLKVKPRDASVYVDGYFAGRVDDFDGMFQKLQIESGPHRVELRLDGYEPLTFEVRIQPDRTVTYTGELKKAP
jgi:PEGA domain